MSGWGVDLIEDTAAAGIKTAMQVMGLGSIQSLPEPVLQGMRGLLPPGLVQQLGLKAPADNNMQPLHTKVPVDGNMMQQGVGSPWARS